MREINGKIFFLNIFKFLLVFQIYYYKLEYFTYRTYIAWITKKKCISSTILTSGCDTSAERS